MARVLLAELLARGVRVESHEAVAVAQQLIQRGAAAPSPYNVRISTDGFAECAGCDATPGVYEMAIFLQTLLPPRRVGVPGGLRYTIARGLHEVEARPFDSIADLSAALERFETGDRRAVVSLLARRGMPTAHIRVMPGAALSQALLQADAAAADEPQAVANIASPAATAIGDELLLRSDADDPAATVSILPLSAAATTHAGSRSSSRWRAAVAAAAAVIVCAAGGFASARLLSTVGDAPAIHRSVAEAEPVVTRPAPAPVAAVPASPSTAAVPDPTPAAVASAKAPAAASVEPPATPAVASVAAPAAAGQPRPAPPPTAADSKSAIGARLVGDQPAVSGEAVVAAVDAQRRPVFSPVFASNGSAMFFHTGGSRDARSAIAVSSTAPGYDLQVMTIVDDGARNYHVQPSPDGRTIAFDSDRDGERGVYLATRDGGDVRRISGPGYAAVPTWSPDGRRIAYIRAEASNPKVWNLWLQSLDDGHVARLTSYRYGQTWSASWFPDGQRICYSHEDRLVIVDLNTGRERVIESPVRGRLLRTPAVSPDGTKVIFQVYRQGAWMLNVADGTMQFVLTDPTAEEFAWAPDGRHVAFHSRRDGAWGIYVIADS
jgi:Tol biopolymer transport system component